MQKRLILTFCGKKKSGKNSAANYAIGLFLKQLGKIISFELTNEGLLITKNNGSEKQWEEGELFPSNLPVKTYSFASILKDQICIDILGLSRDQCYGTDDQKNTLTSCSWDGLPITILEKYGNPSGLMSGRQVMQVVGTDLFRALNPNIWVNALLSKIYHDGDNSKLITITDCRFPNELEGFKAIGAKTIKLSLDISNGRDRHPSEVSLDHLSPSDFDLFIDNQNLTMSQKNEILKPTIEQWFKEIL